MSDLAQPSDDDVALARDVLAAGETDADTLAYVVASMMATERREAARLVRGFIAQVEARLILLDGKPLEQAQMLRNMPQALRALSDVIEK